MNFMDEMDSASNSIEHLTSKLSEEIQKLAKLNEGDDHFKKVFVVKEQLLKEIRDFLGRRNNEVK